jgi:hypothetical protein
LKAPMRVAVVRRRNPRAQAGMPVPLEVGVRGKAVVDSAGRAADRSSGVAFGKPSGEFATEVRLKIDQRGNRVREMNLCRASTGLRRQAVNRRRDARRIEVPFNQKPVGRDAAMKRARRNAVKIRNVAAGNGPEPIEIEVRVFCLERVERPLDETNIAAKGFFALRKLELPADAVIAMGGKNGSHVRMKIRRGVVEAHVGFREANHGVTVESTKNLSACVIGDDVGDVRLGVERVVGPNFTGDLHATMEVREFVERADSDRHKSFRSIS